MFPSRPLFRYRNTLSSGSGSYTLMEKFSAWFGCTQVSLIVVITGARLRQGLTITAMSRITSAMRSPLRHSITRSAKL